MGLSSAKAEDHGFINSLPASTSQSEVAICCSSMRDRSPAIYYQSGEGGTGDPTMSHSTQQLCTQIALMKEAQGL